MNWIELLHCTFLNSSSTLVFWISQQMLLYSYPVPQFPPDYWLRSALKQAQNDTLIPISESRKRFIIPVSLSKRSPIAALLERKDHYQVAGSPKIRQTRVLSSLTVLVEHGEIPDSFSLAFSEFLGWVTESKWLFWDKESSSLLPLLSPAIQTCQESRVDDDYVQRATCWHWNIWKDTASFGFLQEQLC